MILLLDTHLLLWAAYQPTSLTPAAVDLLTEDQHQLVFSAASIWEVSIKAGLGREDFDVDPRVLRRALIENGYTELPVTAAHAAAVSDLPTLHRDPFDRMLVAQARVEGVTLLTADRALEQYGSPVQRV